LPTATTVPTSTATPTSTPTATPTATPTPIPTIQVGSLSVPDPRVTNPELFDLTKQEAPIPQFANALKNAGIELSPEQIAQGIIYISTKEDGTPLVDQDGNPFVVAVYNLDPSLFPPQYRDLAGPIPLMIADKGEGGWGWRENLGRLLFEKNGIDGGTEFTGWLLNNGKWKEIIGKNFTLGTIDYGIYWNEIEPTQEKFDFSIAENQIRLAENKDMKIRGMGLVFPPMYPDWLKNFTGSQEDFKQILKNHVFSIVSHFKGKVDEWTVVTEPFITPYRTNDVLYNKLGYDYIKIAFEAAREADPSATLIYEDTFNHTSDGITTALTHEIVDRLKSEGLIDKVGLEMHIDASQPLNTEDIVKTMRSYGLPISVTSVDVDLSKVSASQEERLLLQADIYAKLLEACLDSEVCTDFSVWGIGDKYHYLDQQNPSADPTPFDDNLNPKMAYFAMMKVLLNNLTY